MDDLSHEFKKEASIDCGWGRLVFGQTFDGPGRLAEVMRTEGPERRDVAIYVRDPHVVLAMAPHEMFLDPSHTYRLDLARYRPSARQPHGFTIRPLAGPGDVDDINRIYAARHMVAVRPDFFEGPLASRGITLLVAEEGAGGRIIGTVMAIDHGRAFGDPARGSSFWCLAVDPQAIHPGIGEALVRAAVEQLAGAGATHTDLTVMHDNDQAIALYDKLGFERVDFFTMKRKNPINERLFTGPAPEARLNPYAEIIVTEARRRGIDVRVTDAEGGFFRLSFGGRSVHCRESLSELTSGVAVSICDDKAVTRRLVEAAGICVPEQIEAGDGAAVRAFLAHHGSVVVKPARGEQGRGIAVGLDTAEAVDAAIVTAGRFCERVLVERCAAGEDLRLIIIDFHLVAAALRRPPRVTGDAKTTLRDLIAVQSRRRAAATGGESSIPLDDETVRCLAASGFTLEDVPVEGCDIVVRRTANLHTGGTIHDVTDEVHPDLVAAGIRAARAIDIPVVGIDLLVRSPRAPDYVFIEANERPGLANHQPQPTAERFIDLLFPNSVPAAVRQASMI
ncbi:N-acetylglutaminylglutamine synthetase [Rhodospirillum rubrum]|uniref:GCN5-related N-acetyltransferase n=1 Tax=Rhodospirillum rubrum (strain ATCC 11170 / ATH 1.1.1 / DSM 467 / LMG 4362 / NCIMB 8255 / S1) TaxID=269796 RepID=Q2RSV7_RHORT|nr:N-acetylglutaminylglutamine synthetase [Rhodospirillum rubrum]ABC22788.1 GCN5-related N-acetyltransferase [Rhodospirillum rubrum ATCC 11170]AEO48509.1 GCN5-related N-acetyltransferase [Rhodospirillum rubrum F11]MBK5954385.1 N-acetylglutaminylglutamine synthetase [Rhodospirillum rubrum]QXG78777.1 N-acetylglutaminylglutamine synthetase [Rhodospirillum rubrum]HCF17602.1 N-acetylglutaminylglutamine synthetase [Rhodospirillum rubrum]